MPTATPGESDHLNPDHPTRGADRNADVPTDARDDTDTSLLPSLDPGVTLLDVEGGRGVQVLHSLVLDHLMMTDGPAAWVDAQGFATTTSLARLAPSQRLLERVHVARGFTAYQHYAAIQRLSNALEDACESAGESPSLLVAPALDAQYAGTDTLHEEHARTLQARALAKLAAYANTYDVPVLVTRIDANDFTEPIENAAERRLVCEQTKLGPRFVGDDFETLLYPDDDEFYQTTLSFWRQVLGTRAAQVGVEPTSPAASGPGAGEIGSGVVVDGSTESFSTDPLLDAWGGRGGR